MKRIPLLALIVSSLCTCDDTPSSGSSSGSVEQAARRGILIAEYIVPQQAELGRYTVSEVWIEKDTPANENHLVVRLIGPHVDTEPRVQVDGLDYYEDYRHIWSERNGPPYEVWAAPSPIPNPLTLRRDGKELRLNLKE